LQPEPRIIVGIIASILFPNLIDSVQKGKQKRTVGDLRNVGTCWMSWLIEDTLLEANVMAIRNAGRDGIFTSTTYPIGSFISTAYDSDMVWADGLFIRYPAGVNTAKRALAASNPV
jgi:hypothetical protein